MFPDGTRLVRLIDEAEFEALCRSGRDAGARTVPGLGRSPSTFPSDVRHGVPAPGVPIPGRLQLGQRPASQRRFEWEREARQAARRRLRRSNNNAVFVQQQTAHRRSLVRRRGRPSRQPESYDTFVSPKVSAGGFLVPARDGGFSSLKVFGNIGKGIKSPTSRSGSAMAFADPSPDLKVERARTADLGVERDLRRSAAAWVGDVFQQRLSRPGGVPLRSDGRRHSGVHQHRRVRRGWLGARAGAAASRARRHRVGQLLATSTRAS